MAQHDMVLDNNPGITFRADVNGALAALVSTSSGTTEPPTPYPGMLWLDTSILPDGKLRQRNQANTAWVAPVGTIGEIRRTVISSSQLWTKPPGLRFLDVVCVGGGGGVGAAPLTAASQGSACSGGGGGGTSRKLYAATDLTPTVSITIGAGGAATPGAGSATTFLGQNAGGGGAGVILAAGVAAAGNGGVGGAASGGDINTPGSRGGLAWRILATSYSVGGDGGESALIARLTGLTTTVGVAGTAGTFPGGGASGPANGVSQAAAAAGAVGGGGAVILTEYY